MQPPFYFKAGDSLSDKVWISAKNAAGWGPPSDLNNQTPLIRLQASPLKIGDLTKIDQTSDSVTFTWKRQAVGTKYYIALREQNKKGKYIDETYENSFTVKNLLKNIKYQIKVTIEGACGKSESEILNVKMSEN